MLLISGPGFWDMGTTKERKNPECGADYFRFDGCTRARFDSRAAAASFFLFDFFVRDLAPCLQGSTRPSLESRSSFSFFL
jgi:hypothetical protein